MKNRIPFLCLFLFLASMSAGCSSGYTPRRLSRPLSLDVTITFPAAGSRFVTWLDSDGGSRSITLPAEGLPDPASITLTLNPDTVTPISVFYAEQEHPLGCVYPGDSGCTTAGGWAAHILSQFLKKTPGENVRLYAGTFNWHRLTTSAEKLEDPWLLDEEAILTAIHDGTFDSSLVRLPKNR